MPRVCLLLKNKTTRSESGAMPLLAEAVSRILRAHASEARGSISDRQSQRSAVVRGCVHSSPFLLPCAIMKQPNPSVVTTKWCWSHGSGLADCRPSVRRRRREPTSNRPPAGTNSAAMEPSLTTVKVRQRTRQRWARADSGMRMQPAIVSPPTSRNPGESNVLGLTSLASNPAFASKVLA